MHEHEVYMQRCFDLAIKGLGKVQPNPMVGAVIVYEGEIVAEGYHEEYGKAHAEVNAINNLKRTHPNAEKILSNCSLYVNLEPCAHYGKTPPCADLIIQSKIPRVVISNIDPFYSVNGKGIEKLVQQGVEVIKDVLREEGYALNSRFFTYHRLQRPYIILKWAETQDGFISAAENEQSSISSQESRILNHRWRTEEQAILVGTKTVLVDNPELTAREWEGRNPTRVIIDKDLKIAKDAKVFNSAAKTLVFNNTVTKQEGNIQYIQIDFYGLVPQFILYQLYLMEIQSVIIEGGSYTIEEFLKYELWDEIRIIKSSAEFKTGVSAPKINQKAYKTEQSGSDTIYYYHRL